MRENERRFKRERATKGNKMKRIVNSTRDYELFLRDRFGNTLDKKIILKAGKNELEIPAHCGYYQSSQNEFFFIYDGAGELDLESECLKKYDFEKLNVRFLDYFLGNSCKEHHKNADENERKVIESFVELMNFNEGFDEPKIVPPYYTMILTLILAKSE